MGKRLLMFIDDLNMPRVDTYGTQQPIALLKLFIERRGLYDRGKELSWKHMKDVQIMGAMGPPGGARNPVDPRFISLFSVFEIQFPSNENLRTIYQVRGRASRPRRGRFQDAHCCSQRMLLSASGKMVALWVAAGYPLSPPCQAAL
jgi:hypothetical protein